MFECCWFCECNGINYTIQNPAFCVVAVVSAIMRVPCSCVIFSLCECAMGIQKVKGSLLTGVDREVVAIQHL